MRPPRKARTTLYRGGSRGDQVKAVVDVPRDRVIVYYCDAAGERHKKFFENDAPGRKAAKTWAETYHHERQRLAEAAKRPGATERRAITHQELWDAYAAAPAFTDLRATSRVAYRGRFQKWLVFRGPATPVNETTLHHVDQFMTEARGAEMAINQIRQVLNVARVVYNWGQQRKLVQTNELALHRWKRPKDAAVHEPEEYTEEEYAALLRELSPQSAGTWRAWVALMLAGHHGQRANAVLHLRWADVDAEEGVIVWPAKYQKNGEDLVQPLTWEAVSALETARYWMALPAGRAFTRMNRVQRLRAEAISRAPWVLPSHGLGRRARDEPWSYQALWRALTAAEKAARVEHRPYRALHGFRKMVAGNVSDSTGDARLAMEWLGDRDMGMAKHYLKRREARLQRAADAITTGGPRREK